MTESQVMRKATQEVLEFMMNCTEPVKLNHLTGSLPHLTPSQIKKAIWRLVDTQDISFTSSKLESLQANMDNIKKRQQLKSAHHARQ